MLKENPDLAKLILRLSVGGMMLLHGISKITHGVSGIESSLEEVGIPGFVAYGVYVGEVLAPLMLIVGFKSRIAALVLAINMVVAVALAHPDDVLALNRHGAWAIELPAFYFFAALCIYWLGPGKYQLRFTR